MFTTPAPAAPTLSTTTSQASPSSPSRSNRLRGLSYLRNYTHSHLHSHSNQVHRSSAARGRAPPSPPEDTSQSTNVTPAQTGRRDIAQTLSVLAASAGSTGRAASGARGPTARFETPHHQRTGTGDNSSSVTNTPDSGALVAQSRMARHRSESSAASLSSRAPQPSAAQDGTPDAAGTKQSLPSIRFIPHNDPRAARPSLTFPPVTRTLPEETAVIRVGRYSERDNQPEVPNNVPSSAPVGFKSKVVSRRHCEFWYSENRWWIKDVKSSSGTFLNHIRLSQPGVESRPYEVKDGDVVQLGIDFRGGEEMIFRCVKIRIECNRGWQQGLNNFNKSTHKRLRNLAKNKTKTEADNGSSHSSECSICLMPIAPCQSLFVAPCSHVWHYKCIRPILQGPTAPSFLCPNCRAVTDLEADIDDIQELSQSDSELEETIELSKKEQGATDHVDSSSQSGEGAQFTPPASITPLSGHRDTPDSTANRSAALDADAVLSSAMARTHINDTLLSVTENQVASSPSPNSVVAPVPISTNRDGSGLLPDRTGVPECPMTPRNDIGPFVLDGSGSRTSGIGRPGEANGAPTGSP